MNELDKWRRDGVIIMGMSAAAQAEVGADCDQKRIEKPFEYFFSKTAITNQAEVIFEEPLPDWVGKDSDDLVNS
jgi:hypothetical protein